MLARGNEVYYARTRSKDNGVGGRSPLNNLGKRARGAVRVCARGKRTKNRRGKSKRGKSKKNVRACALVFARVR